MRVGFIGWRGMVGSVLRQRMLAEGDFQGIQPVFFSTSGAGGPAPEVGQGPAALENAYDLEALARMDTLVTCQGGDYTQAIYGPLRAAGWQGAWIDAASTLRMADDAVIILDPVNRQVIDAALKAGIRTFAGANCTVSVLLMGIVGLFRAGLIEWISTMTFQAASGAGAAAVQELIAQMARLGSHFKPGLDVLALDAAVAAELADQSMPTDALGVPLAGSAIPWIDKAVEGGRTREEWKGLAETNKILALDPPVPVDGLCVRIGALRSHAHAATIKLTRPVPHDELERLITTAHPWVELVPNTADATRRLLTPAATAGGLKVHIGRLHTLAIGPEYLTAFIVGDQLLWGAAEPLRRMLLILRGLL